MTGARGAGTNVGRQILNGVAKRAGYFDFSWRMAEEGFNRLAVGFALLKGTGPIGRPAPCWRPTTASSSTRASSTGTLDIVLPSGLNWTSASGVLLTGRQVTQVPEPASLFILAAGLAILAGMRRGVPAAVGLARTSVVG